MIVPRFAVSVYPINFQTRSSRKLTREWKIVILRYIFLLFFYKESACLFHLCKCTRDTRTPSSIYSPGRINFSSRTFYSFICFHENMNSRACPPISNSVQSWNETIAGENCGRSKRRDREGRERNYRSRARPRTHVSTDETFRGTLLFHFRVYQVILCTGKHRAGCSNERRGESQRAISGASRCRILHW